MLVFDPRYRTKPDDALAHRFFERKPSAGSAPIAITNGANATNNTFVPPSTIVPNSNNNNNSNNNINVGGPATDGEFFNVRFWVVTNFTQLDSRARVITADQLDGCVKIVT